MTQNWDYAELSKAAKAAGGPEKYVEMLVNRGFEQIGTRLFEDNKSYVRVTVE